MLYHRARHSVLIAEVLGVDDPRWTRLLDVVAHDFYHLPGYVRLSATHEGGDPLALYVTDGERETLLPLVARDIPSGGRDVTSPYGYPGPLVTGGDDADFLSRSLTEGFRFLATLGFVSVFVRLHPILNRTLPVGVGAITYHGDTVTVDLSRSPEELWADTRRSHRFAIRRSLRAGHVASVVEDPESFETFKHLYRDTMRRHHASPYYEFDDQYFEGLQAALGDRLVVAVTRIDDVVASAGLFVETCGILQAHLAGTDEAYARHAPTKLLDHFAIRWARDRGDAWYHLGGGIGGSMDSLWMYKAGFSTLRTPFHTLRVVLDEEQYHHLVRTGDPSADPTEVDGYFPLYRQG